MKKLLVSVFIFLLIPLWCQAKEAFVQRGDIAIFVSEIATQENITKYAKQMRFLYLQAIGKATRTYDALDPNLQTWDNTEIPLIGNKGICGHAQLIWYTGSYTYHSDYLILLRPNQRMQSLVDMDAAIDKMLEDHAADRGFNQPELYLIAKWILQNKLGWYASTFDHWTETYGIDFNQVDLQAPQWSPYLGQDCHYDISDERFWERDKDCSSKTWWYIWWGYYVNHPDFGDWTMVHPDWVDASDCLAPGQVADFLTKRGLVTIHLGE